MTIAPLNGYLYIRPHAAKNKSKSGLITNVDEDGKIELATVVTGDSSVKEIVDGMEIIYKSFNADEVEIEGERLTFIKAEDVLAVKQ